MAARLEVGLTLLRSGASVPSESRNLFLLNAMPIRASPLHLSFCSSLAASRLLAMPSRALFLSSSFFSSVWFALLFLFLSRAAALLFSILSLSSGVKLGSNGFADFRFLVPSLRIILLFIATTANIFRLAAFLGESD